MTGRLSEVPKTLSSVPVVILISAVGLTLVAIAYAALRADLSIGELAYWAGILAIVVPVAVGLIVGQPTRNERIGLLVALGIGLYVVKALHSPLGFTLYDELQTLRGTDDVILSGRLFTANPLIPIYSLFPGIEAASGTLAVVTGADVFTTGLMIVGLARLLLVLALFLLVESVSANPKTASLAVFAFAANPGFLFFESQFAYETVALPLAIAAIALAVRSSVVSRLGVFIAILAVTVTHHVSAYLLVGFLVMWWLFQHLLENPAVMRRFALDATDRHQAAAFNAELTFPSLSRVVLFAAVAVVGWTVWVAEPVLAYLTPVVNNVTQLIRLILGESAPRRLFSSEPPPPPWDPPLAFASVLLVIVLSTLGLLTAWRNRGAIGRRLPLFSSLAVVAVTYPSALLLRVTDRGAEIAGRLWDFIFVALALFIAIGIEQILKFRWPEGRKKAPRFAAIFGSILLLIGGLIVGTPRWARFPGPYLVAADTRSIELEGLAAARWMQANVGPDHRIATDRTNRLLMGAYGRQWPVTDYADHVRTSAIFFSAEVTEADRQLLLRGDVEYLIADTRLASSLPTVGRYFEGGEPQDRAHDEPMNLHALTKFGGATGFDLIFDSGHIRIYKTPVEW